ncbi:MAG: hypothetical protein HWE10_07110 [Gammaproteobacteria bacterium]|nr:hypothetical protein [Gammaproteobacteria bacterium]
MDNIAQFIIGELEKYGSIPNKNVEKFNFVDSGLVDSLAIMKFIIAIEGQFNISFNDDDLLLDDFRIVSGLSQIIKNKL